MTKSLPEYLRVFFAVLAALTLAYLPCLLFVYAHHDDFRFWERVAHQLSGHSYFIENIVYGRLISSFLLTVAGWFINNLADLNILRGVSIFQLSISATICIYAVKKYFNDDLRNAFLFIVMIFTLPPFQVMVSYGAYFFLPFALILASWAAAVARTRILLATVLLFCAFATYASAAVFYWFVGSCLMACAWSESHPAKRIAIKIFSAGLFSVLLYAIYLQIIKQFFNTYTSGIYNPYILTNTYPEKLQWFIREPFINALNLWNIFPAPNSTLPAALLIVGAALIYLRQKNFVSASGCFVVFLLLLTLSFLPNLLARGNAPFYRCSAGLTALVSLTLVWALKQWLSLFNQNIRHKILTFILMIGSIYGILSAQNTILTQRIIPSTVEFNYIKNILSAVDLNRFEQIHLILPHANHQTSRYDEFGAPAMVFAQDFRGILTCALRESRKQKELNNRPIKLSVSYQNRKPDNFPRPALIIDMNIAPTGFEPVLKD